MLTEMYPSQLYISFVSMNAVLAAEHSTLTLSTFQLRPHHKFNPADQKTFGFGNNISSFWNETQHL